MRRPRETLLPSLAGLLPSFDRTEVVVVGDFVADEYVYGETERISREAPVLIVRYESSELKAGGAGNAAQNLAALGVKVRAVGVVGDDALGTALLDELEGGGIDVSGMLRVPGRQTEAKTRILAGGRSTRRQQMIRLDRSPREPLPAVIQKTDRPRARASRARARARSSRATTARARSHADAIEALRRLKKAGVPVCVDSRYALRAYTRPHDGEAERGRARDRLRRPALRARRLERAARTLLQARRLRGAPRHARAERHVRLPQGAPARAHRGAREPGRRRRDRRRRHRRGDVQRRLAAGGDPVSAARLANVAGALVVQKPGTATVSREELAARAPPPVSHA